MSTVFENYCAPLLEAIAGDAAAQAGFARLSDWQQRMCLEWIADASGASTREDRLREVARALQRRTFDPFYDFGLLTLAELERLYGAPRLLADLPPAEKIPALNEGRVLWAVHTRNFDAADVVFDIAPPGTRPRMYDLLFAYAPPCVLTPQIIGWLNRNGWETISDVLIAVGLSADWERIHKQGQTDGTSREQHAGT